MKAIISVARLSPAISTRRRPRLMGAPSAASRAHSSAQPLGGRAIAHSLAGGCGPFAIRFCSPCGPFAVPGRRTAANKAQRFGAFARVRLPSQNMDFIGRPDSNRGPHRPERSLAAQSVHQNPCKSIAFREPAGTHEERISALFRRVWAYSRVYDQTRPPLGAPRAARRLTVPRAAAGGDQRCVRSPSGAVSSAASLGSMPASLDASRLVKIPTFAASLTTGSCMTPR
jgi:hypothetical protein